MNFFLTVCSVLLIPRCLYLSLRQNGAYPTAPVLKVEEGAVYFIIAVQMPLPAETSVVKNNFAESGKSGTAGGSEAHTLSAAGSKLRPLPNGASVAVTGLPAFDVNRNLVSELLFCVRIQRARVCGVVYT